MGLKHSYLIDNVHSVVALDPGKASQARFGGVMISYNGNEVNVSTYHFTV